MVDSSIDFESHSGVLADYSEIFDAVQYGSSILIDNQNDYQMFQDSIAKSLMIMVDRKDGSKGKPDVKSTPNSDPYITKKVDFETDHIILTRGKTINKVNVSGNVYTLELGDYNGDNRYSLAHFKKCAEKLFDDGNLVDENIGYCEQRPINSNMNMRIEQRPINSNNRFCEQRPINSNLKKMDFN